MDLQSPPGSSPSGGTTVKVRFVPYKQACMARNRERVALHRLGVAVPDKECHVTLLPPNVAKPETPTLAA